VASRCTLDYCDRDVAGPEKKSVSRAPRELSIGPPVGKAYETLAFPSENQLGIIADPIFADVRRKVALGNANGTARLDVADVLPLLGGVSPPSRLLGRGMYSRVHPAPRRVHRAGAAATDCNVREVSLGPSA
jgi:hypothetical protein